ncbi:hypothetical protein [Clostridium sp. AM33-3]|uniref:hypothetical protein n=1 Tax=Clostridium sp. AM33-3 TaxID=2292304 RepID=UPI000E53BBB5|nr:hypothetical protein [Clostridium sp. AM33-3]RHT20998.1 hypothetical protein DW819_08725 [Clostridium sp. AM33-3]
MIGFAYAQPKIPDGLLHTMYEIQSGAEFRQDNGGQYVPGKETRIPFKGIVMPVNDKDLIRDAAGTYTHCTEKIYTNGHSLQNGAKVMDADGTTYTIIQELGHNSIHPMKRYLIERKEASAKR